MIASIVLSIFGSTGETKNTRGMIRLEASSRSLPKYWTKRLPFFVPALRHDRGVDRIALTEPALAVGRKGTFLGQTQTAIDRDPYT